MGNSNSRRSSNGGVRDSTGEDELSQALKNVDVFKPAPAIRHLVFAETHFLHYSMGSNNGPTRLFLTKHRVAARLVHPVEQYPYEQHTYVTAGCVFGCVVSSSVTDTPLVANIAKVINGFHDCMSVKRKRMLKALKRNGFVCHLEANAFHPPDRTRSPCGYDVYRVTTIERSNQLLLLQNQL
jgi:hypothetical protein